VVTGPKGHAMRTTMEDDVAWWLAYRYIVDLAVECLMGWYVSRIARMWPKRALLQRVVSEMDGRPVVAEIWSFRMNWFHLICSNCLWHFIRRLEGSGVDREEIQVSAASKTELTWFGITRSSLAKTPSELHSLCVGSSVVQTCDVQGRSQRGGHGWMSPPSWIEKIF